MPKIEIYKFVELVFADNFEGGEVRISPAHKFRESDGIDDGRSDSMELTSVGAPAGGVETVRSDQPPFHELIHMYKGGVRVVTQMAVIGAKVTHFDNCLLFCASAELTDEIRNAMATKFNARAVFKIADADAFTRLVSQDVRLQHGYFFRGGRVSYVDQPIGALANMKAADSFSKRAIFAWQAEYRIAWEGPAIESEPFNIQTRFTKSLVKRLADTH